MLLHYEINNTLHKIFFYCSIKLSTIPSRIWNLSDKNYNFHGFLSVQQHQIKYHQEQNWDCD